LAEKLLRAGALPLQAFDDCVACGGVRHQQHAAHWCVLPETAKATRRQAHSLSPTQANGLDFTWQGNACAAVRCIGQRYTAPVAVLATKADVEALPGELFKALTWPAQERGRTSIQQNDNVDAALECFVTGARG